MGIILWKGKLFQAVRNEDYDHRSFVVHSAILSDSLCVRLVFPFTFCSLSDISYSEEFRTEKDL